MKPTTGTTETGAPSRTRVGDTSGLCNFKQVTLLVTRPIAFLVDKRRTYLRPWTTRADASGESAVNDERDLLAVPHLTLCT